MDTPETPTPTPAPVTGPATLTGERRRWHRLTLDFDGPEADERGDPNPFTDYRLDVTFVAPSGRRLVVPGFFAADGRAADTDATRGSVWRARLAPDEVGRWRYRASFVTGPEVAVAGRPADTGSLPPDVERLPLDGASGAFDVAETDKSPPDVRARGRLAYVGDHYFRYLGTGEVALKLGANSPENLLAYDGFSGTWDSDGDFLHSYAPHVDDWEPGDPTWLGGGETDRGRGIVGAVNYLASKGVNAGYFLTYSAGGGDGGDVWPWVAPGAWTRYDVSKLAQWERVFAHMTARGMTLHVLTQETENDQQLGGGSLTPVRRLYYRELVARFGHHPALVWNLGEENTNTTAQRRAFAAYVRGLDPYDHPITLHTFPDEHDAVYGPLLGPGRGALDSASIQARPEAAHETVREWRERSAAAGRPWVVTGDELSDHRVGVPEDGASYYGMSQETLRRTALWGALMAGAGGTEWYFGYETDGDDLTVEDFRSRDAWWDVARHATAFVAALPLPDVAPAPDRLRGAEAYVLASTVDDASTVSPAVLACYLPAGGTVEADLPPGRHRLRWYDPRTGSSLDGGVVDGGGWRSLGRPPIDDDVAAVLVGDR